MTKEKFIEELSKLPAGTEVRIFDWRRNLNDSDGDSIGASEGIYDFEVEMMDRSQVPDGAKLWAGLTFNSIDYDANGRCLMDFSQGDII